MTHPPPGAGGARARRAFTLLALQVSLVLLTIAALGMAALMVANSRHLRRLEADLPDGARKYVRAPQDPLTRRLDLLACPSDTPLIEETTYPPAVNTVEVLAVTKGLLDETLVITAEQTEP
ncbi:MAG: hypothetical protein HZA54_12400 [Planctomycetes bacterium]|nr:hypothetical protein [Planctomycetota bacterium]